MTHRHTGQIVAHLGVVACDHSPNLAAASPSHLRLLHVFEKSSAARQSSAGCAAIYAVATAAGIRSSTVLIGIILVLSYLLVKIIW